MSGKPGGFIVVIKSSSTLCLFHFMSQRDFEGLRAFDHEREDGDRPSGEIQRTEEIENLRLAVRRQLIVFTENGAGRRLIDHQREWKKRIDQIDLLSLSAATDPQEIEALGEKAKALIIEALQTNPAALRKQVIEDLRLLIENNPAAQLLVQEELQRIQRRDLEQDLFG